MATLWPKWARTPPSSKRPWMIPALPSSWAAYRGDWDARYHLDLGASGGFKKSTFWEKTSMCCDSIRHWIFWIRSCSVKVVPRHFSIGKWPCKGIWCPLGSWTMISAGTAPEVNQRVVSSPALGKRDYNTHSYIYMISYNHNPSNYSIISYFQAISDSLQYHKVLNILSLHTLSVHM